MLIICPPHGIAGSFTWIWSISKLRRTAGIKTGNESSINTNQKESKNSDRYIGPNVRRPKRTVRKACFYPRRRRMPDRTWASE